MREKRKGGLRDNIEQYHALKRVEKRLPVVLCMEVGKTEICEVKNKAGVVEGDAEDEVRISYRYVVIGDNKKTDGLGESEGNENGNGP